MTPPRLVYIGDVPVEATVAGANLLYRLFDGYPADRVEVFQSNLPIVSEPQRRLPQVSYHGFTIASTRLLHSRLAGYYGAALLARAGRVASGIAARVAVPPDAIVTIAHAYAWRAADRLSRMWKVPLHLIVHDDCVATMHVAPPFENFVESRFAETYRNAATRFCISPAMRDHYARRFGVTAEVLLPTRARDAVPCAAPAVRAEGGPFTIAFAGSLNPGYLAPMQRLIDILHGVAGRLEIFGAPPAPEVRAALSDQAVSFHPFVPSAQLGAVLRERADALLVPMSFDAEDAVNMRLSFPAKLADFTAMGIPILIVGPGYCAAVAWAHEHPGAAAIVTDSTAPEFSTVVRRLAQDRAWRSQLAAAALRAGAASFDHASAQRRFVAALDTPAAMPAGA